MCDTNWCTFCDQAISIYSSSVYCSHACQESDAALNHPDQFLTFLHRSHSLSTNSVTKFMVVPPQALESPNQSPSNSSLREHCTGRPRLF
ncbi:hypothetical protein CLU79DRAFT_835561 [Phycomyces nitens]|nr:hypothetical protein CLU79DRAFT_835561 [Phycomyces nitens]